MHRYVYSHIITSLRTGFGHSMEAMIKVMFTGERGVWWDVVRKTKKINYYVSVKSGPNDVDKDQAEHFADEVKKIMKKDSKAKPLLCIVYGRTISGIPAKAMKDKGVDPEKYVIVGKKAYEIITGDPKFLDKVWRRMKNINLFIDT